MFTMADIVAELADRGRSLAPADRSRLVELLLESLHEPPLSEIETAWDAEIVRRVQAYKKGEVEPYAADDVFAAVVHAMGLRLAVHSLAPA